MKPLAALAFLLAAAFAPAAQALPVVYVASLSGAAEEPPNASPGMGWSRATIDLSALTLRVEAGFSGLLAPSTVAHIHAPTAVPGEGNVGVAVQTPTLLGFPAGVTAGAYDMTFDLGAPGTYAAGFLTNVGFGDPLGAASALADALAQGRAYFNLHSDQFPAGEIRGFYAPIPVPAAGLLLPLALAALGLAAARARPG